MNGNKFTKHIEWDGTLCHKKSPSGWVGKAKGEKLRLRGDGEGIMGNGVLNLINSCTFSADSSIPSHPVYSLLNMSIFNRIEFLLRKYFKLWMKTFLFVDLC
jgi:hypothetical protein